MSRLARYLLYFGHAADTRDLGDPAISIRQQESRATALGLRAAGDFTVAERVASQVLPLPMFPELLSEQQVAVADGVQRPLGSPSRG